MDADYSTLESDESIKKLTETRVLFEVILLSDSGSITIPTMLVPCAKCGEIINIHYTNSRTLRIPSTSAICDHAIFIKDQNEFLAQVAIYYESKR